MLQNQGKEWVRRRRSAGRQSVFMDVISLMERVSELTSSPYSAASCRGSQGIRPVEMRLYRRHSSHQIRCVRGHFKEKKKKNVVHFCISLSPSFSPNFISSPSLIHTHGAQMDTNSDILENKPCQFRFLRERGRRRGGHILFRKSRHINRFCPSHTQRLCR